MKSTDPVVGSQAEQTFFDDPAIDRLLNMVFSLTAEVHVLRDRLTLLESLVAERAGAGGLDDLVPEGTLEARLSADRASLVRHVLEGVPGRLASKS